MYGEQSLKKKPITRKFIRKFRIHFYYLLTKVLYKLRIRFFIFQSFKGIGHQATEPATFILERKLGLMPYRYIVIFEGSHFYETNMRVLPLFEMWKKHFLCYVLINSEGMINKCKLYFSHQLLYFRKFFRKKYDLLIDNQYHVLSKKIANRAMTLNNFSNKPLLKLPRKYQVKGEEILRHWGIKPNDWFVLFHNRESKYMNIFEGDPYKYESKYSHRNGSVERYSSAIELIIKRGGKCIRFGHYYEPLKHFDSNKVIDYSSSRFHSPEMDMFLLQNCHFFLASDSGPAQTAGYFGTPVVQVNSAPFTALPYFQRDLGLLKLHYHEKEKRYLNFNEIVSNKLLLNSNDSSIYEEAGIKLIDNSQEEICEVCKEMLDRLDGIEECCEENELLQKKFKALFSPLDYPCDFPGQIGKTFLKKYSFLLLDSGCRSISSKEPQNNFALQPK